MPNLVGTGLNQVPTNGMLGGLAYQSPDHASIKNLDLKNLSQINSEIADTAVDIFIYDTSKDSDGGAWRHRTSHTSWYNEELNTTTRGSRREFPAVAVIVLISNHVIIYDGDDPDLPMWMKIKRNSGAATYWYGFGSAFPTATSIYAMNGIIAATHTDPNNSSGGVALIRFIHDNFYRYGINNGNGGTSTINISQRESTTSFPDTPTGTLIDWKANDVAMTVLPNAPIDDATGLPIPTIAVATNGGVSVIKDDGTVIDLTRSSGNQTTSYVDFNGDELIIQNSATTGTYYNVAIPSSDTANDDYNGNVFWAGGTPASRLQYGASEILSKKSYELVRSYNVGFDILRDYNLATNGLVAYATTSYNTGWLHGSVKGAFLSDTDATDVTGSELVTNGTFGSDVSGWTSGTATISYQSGEAKVTSNSGGYSSAYQAITTVIGQRYTVSANVNNVSSLNGSSIYIQNGTVLGPAIAITNSIANGSSGVVEKTFTATATTTYIHLTAQSYAANEYVLFDNVTVRIADPDRSVNNNGLQVFGTVTKSAVATGAELVAYSGFSASNYLIQPYNSDLDFGTGDLSIMFWYKSSVGGSECILHRGDGDASGWGSQPIIQIEFNTTTLAAFLADSGFNAYDTIGIPVATSANGVWNHYVLTRSGGTMRVYFNGSLYGSTSSTRTLTNTAAKTWIGERPYATRPATNVSLALFRMGASAPTDEQVKKIYEDEKVLFQENAACTLYGSSDAVTALAYDEVTERLHVGTSSGRSEFQGLRRINNTTTAVTTAISAYDSFVVEQ